MLYTQENAKLLDRLKYVEKIIRKPYVNHFTNPKFQVVNRRFVVSFGNATDATANSGYYLPKLLIKD